jgi:galactokinase
VVAASAPGRVNLLGEHTDYNGGPVLPVALDRRTAVAAAPADCWLLVSAIDHQVHEVEMDGRSRGDWTDYVAGVVREFRDRGLKAAPARLAVASNLPIGAGLASSAALTVAAAHALAMLAPCRLTAADLVEIAYHAEHDHVGVRCGRMDQTIAAHAERGTALLFETAAGTLRRLQFPGKVWVIETGVSHRLSRGELNQRHRECEAALSGCRAFWPGLRNLAELAPGDLATLERRLPPLLMGRVRHVVTETARTRSAAAALAAGELRRLGELLVEGHESLRRDFGSTVPEADLIVESALQHGAYGARLTGAGWGGAVVILAPESTEARVVAQVRNDFSRRFGRVPVAWSTRASAGVRREPVRRS